MKLYKILLFLVFTMFYGNAQDLVSDKAEYYFKKSRELYNQKNIKELHIYNDSLLHYAQKNDLIEFELRALITKGVAHRMEGKYKEALTVYNTILNLNDTIPNIAQKKTMALINMGNVYGNIKLNKKAIDAFKKALPKVKELGGGYFVESGIYYGLSRAYEHLKEFDSASVYNSKLKDMATIKKDTFLLVKSLTSASQDLIRRKEYSSALMYAREAQKLNEQSKDVRKESDTRLYGILADAFYYQNRLDTALVCVKKALDFAVKSNDLEGEMYCHKDLSKIYTKKGNEEQAKIAEANYLKLNAKYLKEHNATILFDAKNENQLNKQIITTKERTINSRTKLLFLFAGGLLLAVLGLFFTNKKNKRIASENKKIKADYSFLNNQYVGLNQRFQDLAQEIEKRTRTQNKTSTSVKYKNSALNDKDRQRLMDAVLEYMDKEKPYLNNDLTKDELAKKINTNSHHLSEVLTLSFEQNFYNFINIYRVKYAESLLANSANKNSKIETIGYDSGFKSKTSFNRVFKQITGKTPSEYRKK